MLAAAENALLDCLRSHRDVKRLVRTIDTLPKLIGPKLLTKYHADAPALYVVPGRFVVKDNQATMYFTVAGVVRNVAGQEQARKGDGIDLGCDHLATLAIRALNLAFVGGCSWLVTGGEMADDDLFDTAGIAAVEITLESTPIELDADYGEAQIAELPDFTHLHADLDMPPHVSADEHAKWLATPPDLSTSRPGAGLDVQLPGAS